MLPDTTSDHPTQLGNYDILAKIAEGGMGTVYKAKSRATGDVVAIKVISPGTTRNPVMLQRFEREFVAAKVLDHPNVVKAIDYCGTGPSPFLVMEYVDGDSLGQRVERSGALPEAEAVRLVAQVCDGLQRAHKQGLVHRDVKPDNILVTPDGVAKLTDMGLVKEVDNDLNLTKTGRGLGTPHYMAPEQFRNAKGVDVRGDIYSLGATLYALVTGVVPFANSNPLDCWMKKIRNEFPAPKELNPVVSDRVDWAIRRAMSAEPGQRPASCREFVEDLTGQSRTTPAATRAAAATPPGAGDLWYMVYRDETGQTHTVKGATANIRSALKDNLLGDAATILVGRSKSGQFLPIGSVPEFRDLVLAPAPLTPTGRTGSGVAPVGSRPAAGEVGASASGNRELAGRGGSGRVPPPPPPGRQTPADSPRPAGEPAPRVTVPTPHLALDTQMDTLDFGTANPTPPPLPVTAAYRRTRPAPEPAKTGFDWTPFLLVLIAFLSAAVGYLLFMK